jgi:hypothetical protein
MPINVASRVDKTRLLVNDRDRFLDSLRWDIGMTIRRAAKLGFKPAIRINGTSDLPWIALQMAREFPQVRFYDYTKLPKPFLRIRPNYAITFSYSGHNLAECMEALRNGVNVSVVFNVRKVAKLPKTWNGYRVIDGDKHDLRFLDRKRVIVGLRPKGKVQPSAFLVEPSKLIQILVAA